MSGRGQVALVVAVAVSVLGCGESHGAARDAGSAGAAAPVPEAGNGVTVRRDDPGAGASGTPRAGSSASIPDGAALDAGVVRVIDAAIDAGWTSDEAGSDDDAAGNSDPCLDAQGADAAGCPCEPGTAPAYCDPSDQRAVQNGVSGTIVCSEGVMYCRNATWSECEILWQYATFVPD